MVTIALRLRTGISIPNHGAQENSQHKMPTVNTGPVRRRAFRTLSHHDAECSVWIPVNETVRWHHQPGNGG